MASFSFFDKLFEAVFGGAEELLEPEGEVLISAADFEALVASARQLNEIANGMRQNGMYFPGHVTSDRLLAALEPINSLVGLVQPQEIAPESNPANFTLP